MWTGPPAAAIGGWVRAAGTITKKLSRLEDGLPDGTYAQINMQVAALETDPRNALTLGPGGGTGPQCPAFAGSTAGWQNYVTLSPPFNEPGCGVAPQLPGYGQYLLCSAEYDPGAGITVGAAPGQGALARYRFELACWDIRIVFEVRCFRGGQAAGAPATALVWPGDVLCARAQDGPFMPLETRCLGLGPTHVTAVALNPCGSRVRVFLSKPAYDVPWPFLDDEVPARPAGPDSGVFGLPGPPGGGGAPGCTVGTGLAVDLVFEVNLETVDGERFVPCRHCDQVPTVPCACVAPWIFESLGGGLWEPPNVSVSVSEVQQFHGLIGDPHPVLGHLTRVETVATGVSLVRQCSEANVSTCGASFWYRVHLRTTETWTNGTIITTGTDNLQVAASAGSGVAVGNYGSGFTGGYAVWFDADPAAPMGLISLPVHGSGSCPMTFSEPTLPPPAGTVVQDNGASKSVRTTGFTPGEAFDLHWDYEVSVTRLVPCRSGSSAGGGGGGAPTMSGPGGGGGSGCGGCGGGVA